MNAPKTEQQLDKAQRRRNQTGVKLQNKLAKFGATYEMKAANDDVIESKDDVVVQTPLAAMRTNFQSYRGAADDGDADVNATQFAAPIDSPYLLEVDSSDEDISFMTPPNAIRRRKVKSNAAAVTNLPTLSPLATSTPATTSTKRAKRVKK